MPAASDRLEFAPPPQPALVRAFVLALLAHLLLVGALTWGVNWKREAQTDAVEAELWSQLPQQAAPKEVAPPPPPPAPAPAPVPEPLVKAPPQPEPPQISEAEIALEKQKKAEAKHREEEAARKKLEAKRKAEEEKLALERQRRASAEKQQRREETEKRLQAEADAKKKQHQQELLAKQLREENLKRMLGQAGATGAPSATGNAQRSSGPSDSWAGRIRARVKPNIVFTDDVAGNPSAEIEVRLAPDGTITGTRVVKPSGNKAWDDAVRRALDKTEVLPRDTDGRVHSPVVIEFRPKG